MSIFEFLYGVIIGPLKLILEVIFAIGARITNNVGLGIVFLSAVLNILLLPLYNKADEIQRIENEKQNLMKPDVDFIKKTFKGNEQFYILQTYYRQHDYNPVYSLRSSISLLLQIPFFIAAYDFLSGLTKLNGVKFGPIANLGQPDNLLLGLNVLPILMTVINVASTIVYTKGQPLKQKLQLYIMAGLFLILLYNTPAALSFYYLLNNFFSLIKNILGKIKNKEFYIALAAFVTSLFGCVKLILSFNNFKKTTAMIGILFFAIILICSTYYLIKRRVPKIEINIDIPRSRSFFVTCGIFLSILCGLFIPSNVINSSPQEFVDVVSLINPVNYIIGSFSLSFGLFVFWFNIYYLLLNDEIKKVLTILIFSMCVLFTINYLFFNNNYGNMSNHLVYDIYPSIESKSILINASIMILMLVATVLISLKYSKVIKNIVIIASISLFCVSALNLSNINAESGYAIDRLKKNTASSKIFPLSKENKNVIVIMLDRAISAYIPYILEEKPLLQEQFAGFTFYPNAISFGGTTNLGTPSLFGGYEYTPEEINKRSNESLKNKQNEALKVMPSIFDSNNYDVVIADPPYAGYSWVPDLSIYDDMRNVKSYITGGMYREVDELNKLKRNLFAYSIMKAFPTFTFSLLYNNGEYLQGECVIEYILSSNNMKTQNNLKTQQTDNFSYWYEVLCNLNELSYFTDGKGSFLMLQNSATHEPTILQEPDYIVSDKVDNSLYKDNDKHKISILGDEMYIENEAQLSHYHVDMASIIQLGKWFDYLRENGVYDNTKIIIVSDHGSGLGHKEDLLLYDDDMMYYNALFMIKDFESQYFTIDNSFMTLADVPYLSTKDLIEKPVNPYTGKEIVKVEKEGTKFNVFGSKEWDINTNNGNTFKKGIWYSVHDDCLDPNNWEIIQDPSVE